VARLSLFINGTAYDVHPIDADGSAAARAFRLRKFDGTEYDVAQAPQGLSCDCPDFTFHREGIDPEGCKHIKALVACGLVRKTDRAKGAAPDDDAMRQVEPSAARATTNPPVRPEEVPANGQPTSFVEVVEHEAMGYRAWGTPVGDFLGEQLGRIARLIRWTGARTPADHDDRIEAHEAELRARDYDRGYHDGLELGRRETYPCGQHD
jgi:hypothetical protein